MVFVLDPVTTSCVNVIRILTQMFQTFQFFQTFSHSEEIEKVIQCKTNVARNTQSRGHGTNFRLILSLCAEEALALLSVFKGII